MTKNSVRRFGAALLTMGMAACSAGEAAEEAPALETAEVELGDLLISAEATGQVEPIREVEVKSKASGEILRLFADVGDEVEPGALLAAIDPRDVQNRFDQVEADMAVAQARLEISQAQLDRSDRLLAAEVITPQEHENARLDFANAQANMVKAETNFELAELQLQDVRISAPMAGTIIQKNVEEGVVIQSASGNVSGGTTLFLMANLNEMQVRTLVDETDMGELAPGMTTIVNVEAFPDRTFRGTVDKIEPQATVEQNVTMFPVIVSIDNRGGLLKPGMNAEVEIQIDQARGVLTVPNSAIVQTSDVGPAAMALGLNVEELDLTQFMRAGFAGRGGRGGEGGAGGGQRGGRGGDTAGESSGPPAATDGQAVARAGRGQAGEGTAAAGGAAAGDPREAFAAMRARVEAGEMTQEEMRAQMGAMMAAGGGDDGAAAPARESRPAVVFVMGADGVPVPTMVQIGLNDWDRTQIVSGVEEGQTLAVVGAAQLMAQQQAFLAQMRERMGGGSPFGGGGAPRGGGRGR